MDRLCFQKLIIYNNPTPTIYFSLVWSCSVWRKCLSGNCIWCTQYRLGTHKRGRGIIGRLSENVVFICGRCTEAIKTRDSWEIDCFKYLWDSLEVVNSFCYLRYLISSWGRCTESVIASMKIGWIKFGELLILLITSEWKENRMMHAYKQQF